RCDSSICSSLRGHEMRSLLALPTACRSHVATGRARAAAAPAPPRGHRSAPEDRLGSIDDDSREGIMKLLPLASEPFVAPTDRDMLPSERREFVRTHRTCIFGYARRGHGPSMSVVYYIPTDEDELLVSTMRGRAKTRAVERTGKVSLCVLD